MSFEHVPRIRLERANRRNLYWARRLGWDRAFNAIVRLLGFRRQTPALSVFSQAVARWQRANGLVVDGILGPKTWRAMRRVLRGRSTHQGPADAPTPPRLSEIALGKLTLKSNRDFTRTIGLYQFTPEDLLVTARMLEGENSGRETPETAAIVWSMLNLYAFLQHHRSSYPTFASFLYKYSSPLHPGRPLRNRSWRNLKTSSRRMAIRGLRGQLPNPVGNATDFANPYIYFKRRYGRAPNYQEWRNYIARHTKRYMEWIGEVDGIKQFGRNTFYINKRVRNVPTGVVKIRW